MQKVFNKNQTGFTLFELLVSIAIIGTISAIFIVNINQSTRDNELNETVTMLNEQIRELQNNALSSKQAAPIGLYAQTLNNIIIFSDDNEDYVYQNGEMIETLVLPTNITVGVDAGSSFSGQEYDGTPINDNSDDHLLVLFFSPDSRVEIHIRQIQADVVPTGDSHLSSYVEFDLYHTVSSETKKVRINDFGLFDVIEN
jgi:prepilin-type N-terminal cleavage/methylation domain-containing protein